ncbi:Uu.00g141290.m01.CDS01 [Anthostomella pinea]|uniref:Uu.00g141290.m01.CDS01 n=1 Tax=Anthostomella pinea TaxID=933095 RepID=A0AAI8VR61_9PEZI|nr:Uu.00g141290.m01.CDS01 [Anthostomella pinea]
MTRLNNRYRCRVQGGAIVFEHVAKNPGSNMPQKLHMTFERTIRVPDNADKSELPPSFGSFPLYKVRDYATRLPAEITNKGGVFFPMYQKEAMWIDFKADAPFMIKIYAGGVNVVSGEHAAEDLNTKIRRQELADKGENVQDYVVAPLQRWIDGIAVSPGVVRQFVAMPMGQGYSVEAQLTGQKVVGGMQFEVTPTLPMIKEPIRGPRLPRPSGDSGSIDAIAMSARAMGISAGGKIVQNIVKDTVDPERWNKKSTMTIPVHILNSEAFRQVTDRDPHPCPITASDYAQAGFPFFRMYEEPTDVSGRFGAVRSVNTLDIDRGLVDDDESSVKPRIVDLRNPGRVDLSTVEDPHGLVDPAGPLLDFRPLAELEQELEDADESSETLSEPESEDVDVKSEDSDY